VSELDLAHRDLRRDAIDEVAESMPGASAREVVAAIVAHLERGLPRLVSVRVRRRP